MGYSSRKPYYNLGMSQKEFFGGSSRFLKQSLDKESVFEKPYLDEEYPQMHLNLPEPSWPSWKPSAVRGPFGEVRRSLLARYIFPPPDCGLARESSTAWAFHWWNSCGDVTTIAFQADSFFKTDWSWTYSLSSEDIDLNALTIEQDSKSISISTDVSGTYGTVLVCGTGYGGQVPLVWETTYREGEDYRLFLGPPRLWNQIAGQEAAVHCCEEVIFDCDACVSDPAIAWDYGTSAATIAQSDTCVIAITGLSTPFDWSVSGTGFTLANSSTTGLTNTLISDAGACGPATITVTGCDSVVATGCVRCTEGQWTYIDATSPNPGPITSQATSTLERISGKYKTIQSVKFGTFYLLSGYDCSVCNSCGIYLTDYDCDLVNNAFEGNAQNEGCCCIAEDPGPWAGNLNCMESVTLSGYEWTCVL